MNVFEQLMQSCEDVDTCGLSFRASRDAAKEICGAVRDRLESEREQAAARIAELETQQQDLGRSETVRRMAGMELEQLRGRTYAVTEEEQAAFDAEIGQAETALVDLRKAQAGVREAIVAVTEEVNRLRLEALGHQDTDLMARWLEGVRTDFDRLG